MPRSAYLQAGGGGLSLFLFVAFWCAFGFYHETNDDLVYQSLLSGLWAHQPVTDFLYYHYFTAHFYAWLYGIFPNIEWYALSMYFLLFWACVNCFLLLHKVFDHQKRSILIYFQILFFVAAFCCNPVFFNFTRSAILLCGSSILLLAAKMFRLPEGGKPSSAFLLWCFVGFALAHLTRPEAVYLCLLLFLPILALLALLHNKAKKALKTMLIPFLVILLTINGLHSVLQSQESKQTLRKTSYIANIVNAHLWQNNATLSPSDTLVRAAIKHWFFADGEQLSMQRLQKLTYGSRFTFNQTVKHRIGERFTKLRKRLLKPHFIPLLVYLTLVFILLIICANNKRQKRTIAVLFCHQLWFWSVLLAVYASSKLPDRLLYPLLGLNLLLSIALLPQSFSRKLGKSGLLISLCVALLCLPPFLFGMRDKCKDLQYNGRQNQQILRQINASFSQQTLIYTAPSFRLLEDLPTLSKFDLKDNNNHLLIQGWASGLPFFEAYMQSICGVGNVLDFFTGATDKETAFFIADKSAMDFFVQYFEGIHQLNFGYEAVPVPSLSRLLEKKGLKIYKLNKI